MRTEKIYLNSLFVACALLLATACKKLDLAPSDRFTELTFWQSDLNATNFLTNVYSGIYTSDRVIFNDAMTDNAVAKAAGNTDAIASGNFTISLSRFLDDWGFYYGGIKNANIFLENIDKNTTLAGALKDRMKGEARFIRAWHHFNLMKWYGDVPLLKKDVSADEAKQVSRAPRADVLAFVLEELDAAAAALPNSYDAANLGRITKGAALALKARVLLYEGNRMAEVVTICEQIINQQVGTFALAGNYADLFSNLDVNKKASESIFALQYVPLQKTWGENIDLVPISVGARTNGLSPTQELVNDYLMLNGKAITEAGSGYDENNPYVNRDPRLTATIVYDNYRFGKKANDTVDIKIKPGSGTPDMYSRSGQGSTTGYYVRKFWDPNAPASLQSGMNVHLIRYAEVLLMYAEAKHSLAQMTQDVWDKTIRALRVRAGFTQAAALDYPGNTNMTAIIRRERRIELALEGIRIDDLRRWKLSETVLNAWAHGAKYSDDPSIDNGYIRAQLRTFDVSKHYLWPIPPNERDRNTNLGQNSGYPQ